MTVVQNSMLLVILKIVPSYSLFGKGKTEEETKLCHRGVETARYHTVT